MFRESTEERKYILTGYSDEEGDSGPCKTEQCARDLFDQGWGQNNVYVVLREIILSNRKIIHAKIIDVLKGKDRFESMQRWKEEKENNEKVRQS